MEAAFVHVLQECVAVRQVVFDILANLTEGGSHQFRKGAVRTSHDWLLSRLCYEVNGVI